jgi:CheY-like chemotaxis protein
VLVADGYNDARVPVARYLDRFGFLVLEAATASDAVDMLDRHEPAAILSGLRGEQAALLYSRLASAPPAVPRVVIVLLSSNDDPVPSEATGVLTKPFSLRPMLDQLRRKFRAPPASRPRTRS